MEWHSLSLLYHFQWYHTHQSRKLSFVSLLLPLLKNKDLYPILFRQIHWMAFLDILDGITWNICRHFKGQEVDCKEWWKYWMSLLGFLRLESRLYKIRGRVGFGLNLLWFLRDMQEGWHQLALCFLQYSDCALELCSYPFLGLRLTMKGLCRIYFMEVQVSMLLRCIF